MRGIVRQPRSLVQFHGRRAGYKINCTADRCGQRQDPARWVSGHVSDGHVTRPSLTYALIGFYIWTSKCCPAPNSLTKRTGAYGKNTVTLLQRCLVGMPRIAIQMPNGDGYAAAFTARAPFLCTRLPISFIYISSNLASLQVHSFLLTHRNGSC